MKRILILLFVVVLIFAQAIPVLAVKSETYPELPYFNSDVEPEDMHMPMLDWSARAPRTALSATPAKSYIRVMLSTLGANPATSPARDVQTVIFNGKYTAYVNGVAKFNMQPATAYTLVRTGSAVDLRLGSTTIVSGNPIEFREHENGSANYFTISGTPGTNYPGDLFVHNATLEYSDSSDYSALFCINRLYIEDYLKGVVSNEMPSSFHIEAIKAQALTARTYAAYRIRPSNPIFDIWDSTKSQVYKGKYNNTSNANTAIEQTARQVITYNGLLIDATYSASNGGQTSLSSIRWSASYPFEKLTEDPYDREYVLNSIAANSKSYGERVDFLRVPGGSTAAPYKTLSQNALGGVAINDLTMEVAAYNTYKFPAGTCSTYFTDLKVSANSASKVGNIYYKDLYISPSTGKPYGYFTNGSLSQYWLIENADSYTLLHARFGHAIGMSQVGAHQMASAYGKTVNDIINFYYTNVAITESGEIGAKEPLTPQPTFSTDYTVTLALPQNLGNSYTVNVDGADVPSANITNSGNNISFKLKDGSAKVVTLYTYTPHETLKDILYPTGMHVYLLTYLPSGYSAVYVPEFKDLLTYHGFAVRITGKTGMRVISGIGESVKNNLKTNGYNGFKLKEYGTVSMKTSDNKTYPLVIGGTKVLNPGKAYYISGNTVYDTVYATANGRVQFTSVLTGLPKEEYASDLSFRPYIILQKNNETLTIYGPVAQRSLYAVATLVNNYAVGTDAYNFLKAITNYVESISR